MKLKKLSLLLILVFALAFIPNFNVKAMSGNLLVEKVWTEPASVEPGQTFKLNFTLRNVGSRDLQNISLKLISIEGKPTLMGFSPVDTTNEIYCDSIKKDDSSNLSINLIADAALKVGAYNLLINLTGQEKYGTSFEDNKIIGIVVQNKPNLIITNLDTDEGNKTGINKKIKLDFANAGNGTLSNVIVTLTAGSNIYTKYIGTVEATDENTYEQTISTNKDLACKLDISYFDELSKAGSLSKQFDIKVPKQEVNKATASNGKSNGFLSFLKKLFGLGS